MLENGVSSVLVAQAWRTAGEQLLFGFMAAVLLWISPYFVRWLDG